MTRLEMIKSYMDAYVLPFLIYTSAILFPLSLLLTKSIDGASYVALNALILFGYGVYKFHPRIVEFSVGGSSIKLKETLHEAEKITEELKELRRVSMLQFFSSMYATTGNNHEVMKRFYDFLCVYNVSAESPALILEFKTEFINSLSCLQKSMVSFLKPFFDYYDDPSLSFDAKVKAILQKFGGETEEHYTNFPGHRMARDFSTNLILIEEIYQGVFNNDPKPVKIPEFVGSYKVAVYRG
ncbi:hypothetical protein EKL29_10515 [Pantoea sp. YU22]|uniref:hypothetical protein n=1 Tax=Pantoea sp. YU22 TaxID=2497684 RepID=UPI000F86A662|nr:hypothetical protein [Pantoea sp. YU22]RTY58001.1 hypothetical protein EKL29_10515 [Pantoea sp. YU22]